jgi:hypothetical protein
MPAPSLYQEGWRQGALIRAPLLAHYVDVNAGATTPRSEAHDLWLLATQDCDLAQTRSTNATRHFELRPVFTRDENDRLDGLRTRSIIVHDQLVLRADSPRITLTARALNTFKNQREEDLPVERRAQIKAWLGLRYDRPAVPERFEKLARLLKERCIAEIPAHLTGVLRDVLVSFESPTEVRLFFILHDNATEAGRNNVLDWADDTAGELLDDHGIIVLDRQAETSKGTSLWVIQNYHGLDCTDLSIPS